MRGSGDYNPDFREKALALKEKRGWHCERCGHAHDPEAGYSLTVHHLDGDKGNDAEWNMACLCQRCHLTVQGRVFMPQRFMFDHSEWFKPHVEGYYKAMSEKI